MEAGSGQAHLLFKTIDPQTAVKGISAATHPAEVRDIYPAFFAHVRGLPEDQKPIVIAEVMNLATDKLAELATQKVVALIPSQDLREHVLHEPL